MASAFAFKSREGKKERGKVFFVLYFFVARKSHTHSSCLLWAQNFDLAKSPRNNSQETLVIRAFFSRELGLRILKKF